MHSRRERPLKSDVPLGVTWNVLSQPEDTVTTDEKEVKQKVKERTNGKQTQAELRERGLVVGTAEEIAEQINAYCRAGVQRIMLQWLDLDDLQGLEALAKGILHLQE